jgi:hypothetical protein
VEITTVEENEVGKPKLHDLGYFANCGGSEWRKEIAKNLIPLQ